MPAASDRLFVLFIHYNLKRGRDWEFDGHRIKLFDKAQDRLQDDIESLLPLLEPQEAGWHGFAFLFLDPGWQDLFRTTGLGAAALGAALTNFQNGLRALVTDRPVRLVSAYRLIELLQTIERVGAEAADELEGYLVGPGGRLRYDSVKVIEAVIRIANFSRNAPILRFDDDVIFPRTGDRDVRQQRVAKTREGVMRLCRHFDELSANWEVNYFIFSGSYLAPRTTAYFDREAGQGEEPPSEGSDSSLVQAAIDGFATRVVQLAEVPELTSVDHLDPQDPALDRALQDIPCAEIELGTVRRFLRELWEIGANPFRQVISGAGLCLSDSAILDLPPYSNMRENVMWIDDHLKFSLHHELRHFGLPATTAATVKAVSHGIGRLAGASFRQERHPDGVTLGDVRWHTNQYLPRLLRGAIADSWLREDPRLKCPASLYSPDEWVEVLRSAPGRFAKYFNAAARRTPPGQDIRQILQGLALERLKRIVELWSDGSYSGTFLHLVTRGGQGASVRRWKELGFFPEICPDGLAPAVDELSGFWSDPGRQPSPALAELVDDLIDDFLEYPKLVLFWKHFVQATRLLLNEQPAIFWPFPIPDSRQAEERGLT